MRISYNSIDPGYFETMDLVACLSFG